MVKYKVLLVALYGVIINNDADRNTRHVDNAQDKELDQFTRYQTLELV